MKAEPSYLSLLRDLAEAEEADFIENQEDSLSEEERETWNEYLEDCHENGELPFLYPLDEEEIEEFRSRFQVELGSEPPGEFLEFLRYADGFAYNGVFIYGSGGDDAGVPGIIENNDSASDEQEVERQFLGHSDRWLYARDVERDVYLVLDIDDGEVLTEFDSFEDMLCRALAEALELDDSDDDDIF